MPNWTTAAPEGVSRSGIRLIRTPSARPLTAFVVSDKLLGCPTHYVGNRTIPCERPQCDACEAGHSWRWHGYLAITLSATSELVLFEMTAQAATTFTEYYERHGTTRGAAFKATRLNNRPNGRVIIHAKPADLAKVTLPKPPNVPRLLCHIWNIPDTQATEPKTMTRPPAGDIEIDRSQTGGPVPIGNVTRIALHSPGGNGKGNGKGPPTQ